MQTTRSQSKEYLHAQEGQLKADFHTRRHDRGKYEGVQPTDIHPPPIETSIAYKAGHHAGQGKRHQHQHPEAKPHRSSVNNAHRNKEKETRHGDQRGRMQDLGNQDVESTALCVLAHAPMREPSGRIA